MTEINVLFCDECGLVEEFDEIEYVPSDEPQDDVWFIDMDFEEDEDGEVKGIEITKVLCPKCDKNERES